MSDGRILRMLGAAAVVGGVLRIASAFIPYAPNVMWLEVLYFVIDEALLLGLIGFFVAHRERLGFVGFIAAAVAGTGIALIVGPDAMMFGVDFYRGGVLIITVGLTLLSLVILVTRAAPWWIAVAWIGAAVVGFGGAAMARAELGFLAGGVLFGLGFVAAGVATMKAATPPVTS